MSPVASPAVRHIEWLSKQPACTVSVDYTTRIARSAPLTAHFFSFVPGSSWSQGRKGPWEGEGRKSLSGAGFNGAQMLPKKSNIKFQDMYKLPKIDLDCYLSRTAA